MKSLAVRTQPEDNRTCALYCRVSTVDQGERYSLPSQLTALRAKAAREGYAVREVFTDTFSGKVASRPAFDRMNALVASRAIGAVFAYSVDRFSRRTEDALRLAREYKRHGVKLDFVESFYEDTPTGRFSFVQLAAFGELWAEKLAADSARGRRQKLESGKLTHGTGPYAFVYIDKRQKDGARLEVDPVKAVVVQDVFRWRLEGMSGHAIARKLNEAGIRSAGYNGKPGGLWSGTTVRQMLRNPTYCGKHICSGIEVACPAIIDEATWKAAQRISDENRQRLVGRPSRKYLLRSFLWCAKCGRRAITKAGRQKCGKACPNYLCGNIEYKPYRRICRAPQIACAKIESAVWQAIWSLLKSPRLLLELGAAYNASLMESTPDTTAGLEREHAKLEARIKTTRRMMRDSLMEYAEGQAGIRQDEARLREIEHELTAAGRVLSLPPRHATEAALREITSGPEPSAYQDRRGVLERIVDLRVNYYSGDVVIEGKVPVAAPASGKKNWDRSQHGDLHLFVAKSVSAEARWKAIQRPISVGAPKGGRRNRGGQRQVRKPEAPPDSRPTQGTPLIEGLERHCQLERGHL